MSEEAIGTTSTTNDTPRRPAFRRKAPPAAFMDAVEGAEEKESQGQTRAAVGKRTGWFSRFERSGDTFKDRAGEPDELSAAIGHVVHACSELGAQIDTQIAKMLGAGKPVSELVTRMMPYRSKVDALSALVRYHATNGQRFNTGDAVLSEVLGDLLRACDEAGEYRRRVLGEGWNPFAYLRQDGAYRHVSRDGVTTEAYDADYIKDVADFIGAVSMDVRTFFISPEPTIIHA